MNHRTAYRTIQVDGLSIFYREAGPETRRASFYCTAFLFVAHVRTLSSTGCPIVLTSSRQTIRALATTIARTQNSSPTP